MTTHELPEEPVFAFAPAYELPDQPQQIRIVFDGMDGYVPTALVALTLADAERLCDYGDDRTMVRCRVKAP